MSLKVVDLEKKYCCDLGVERRGTNKPCKQPYPVTRLKVNNDVSNICLTQPTVGFNASNTYMMRHHGGMKSQEANEAAWAAGKGALVGAARVRHSMYLITNTVIDIDLQWGMYGAVLGGAGYALSPIYRGLTVQFKV